MNKIFTRKTRAKRIKPCIVAILSLGMVAAFAADDRTVAENFDTTKTVTLKGTVTGVLVPPGVPVCILIDVNAPTGKPQHWVVEGDTLGRLRQAGWAFFSSPGTVKLGDTITVSTFLAKAGSKAADLLVTSLQLPDKLKPARVAHGIEVTLPNGKKLPFGASQ